MAAATPRSAAVLGTATSAAERWRKDKVGSRRLGILVVVIATVVATLFVTRDSPSNAQSPGTGSSAPRPVPQPLTRPSRSSRMNRRAMNGIRLMMLWQPPRTTAGGTGTRPSRRSRGAPINWLSSARSAKQCAPQFSRCCRWHGRRPTKW